MLNESAWKDKVELKIYHLDEDPRPGRKYQPVESSTVVVNGKKLSKITPYAFFQALEEAEKSK